MNGDMPHVPITTLAGITSLTDLLNELPLPSPLPATTTKSLLFSPRVGEDAARLLSCRDDALVAQLCHALAQVNTEHIEVKDSLGSEDPDGDVPALLQSVLARSPSVFKEKSLQSRYGVQSPLLPSGAALRALSEAPPLGSSGAASAGGAGGVHQQLQQQGGAAGGAGGGAGGAAGADKVQYDIVTSEGLDPGKLTLKLRVKPLLCGQGEHEGEQEDEGEEQPATEGINALRATETGDDQPEGVAPDRRIGSQRMLGAAAVVGGGGGGDAPQLPAAVGRDGQQGEGEACDDVEMEALAEIERIEREAALERERAFKEVQDKASAPLPPKQVRHERDSGGDRDADTGGGIIIIDSGAVEDAPSMCC